MQTDQPADLPVITGLGVNAPTAGRFLSLTTEAQSEQIADLMEQLYAQDLAGSCTRIDMGLGTDAYFVYDGRIKVLLGTFNNLDYKLSVAALLLKNSIGAFKKRFDANEVGGTALLGISQPVIKAHGSSNAYAFFNAIRQAQVVAQADIVGDIAANVAHMRLEPGEKEG